MRKPLGSRSVVCATKEVVARLHTRVCRLCGARVMHVAIIGMIAMDFMQHEAKRGDWLFVVLAVIVEIKEGD